MHFYEALKFILTMHGGVKVSRKAWYDPNSPFDKRYICKGYDNGNYFIHYRLVANDMEKHMMYTPSQADMTANDWYIMEN